jgi:hypothetical protein
MIVAQFGENTRICLERLVATKNSISQGRWSSVRDFKLSILEQEAGMKHTATMFMFSARHGKFIAGYMTAFPR